MNGERRGDDRFDARVDHAWRRSSNETPSARVDESILAAARSEAARARDQEPRAPISRAGAPRSRWPTLWQPLAVAAGVAGLAFTLIQLMPAEHDVEKPITFEASESGAPATQSAVQPSVPAASTGAASREIATPAPAAPGAVPPAPPAPEERNETDATAGLPAPALGDAVAARPRAIEAPSAASEVASATLAPAEWARRIGTLHEAGDVAGAEFELRAFRAEYPNADTFLPPALRAWAASVK